MEEYRHPITEQQLCSICQPAHTPVILEVGAHDGSDTARMLQAIPNANIHCFEPDRRPFRRLQERFIHDTRVWLTYAAASDVDGTKLFYPSMGKAGGREDWDLSGSLREPTLHKVRSPNIMFGTPVEVPCVRLDGYVARVGITLVDLAWVDVQGAQVEVIAGATCTLACTRWLYMECHPKPLYDGEPTPQEFLAVLGAKGFDPVALYEGYTYLLQNRHPKRRTL